MPNDKRYVTVVPAYGRDYTTQKAVKADWDKDMDFKMDDMYLSGYINKANAADLPHLVISVRYAKGTKLVRVTK
jgi:hypothetical protein